MAKELSKEELKARLKCWKAIYDDYSAKWPGDEQAYQQIRRVISTFYDTEPSKPKVSKEFLCQKAHDFAMEYSLEEQFDDVREFFVTMLREIPIEVEK